MVSITLNIPNDKAADFKAGFLKIYPKTDDSYSDKQWIKKKIREWMMEIYRHGKDRIWEDTHNPGTDESAVDEVSPDQ